MSSNYCYEIGAQEYEDEDDETVVNEESITTDQGEPSPISEEERIFIKQVGWKTLIIFISVTTNLFLVSD